MSRMIGILLFDGAEEMDLVVRGRSSPLPCRQAGRTGVPVAERREPIVCETGLRVIRTLSTGNRRPSMVCSSPAAAARNRVPDHDPLACRRGHPLLLVSAGLAWGRPVTTHHDFLDPLHAMAGADVIEGIRFVRDATC